ncbi:MAG: DUF2652 domain-containing protein [Anaerolineales bacterium]|nr:DUF2652 domain-containing protein [Anaerolineales bacterium]
MELKQVALVLVDISGYTDFLRYRSLSLLHAEDIITQLLESVIDAAQYPLVLNKLEGDAAFLYAPMDGDQARIAEDILQQVRGFFISFHRKALELSHDTARCNCGACTQIDLLKLKAFLHHGEMVIKKIRHFEELAGEHVILIHRLLKNSVPAEEYILMTDEFPGFRKEHRTELYESTDTVEVDVFYPLAASNQLMVEPSVSREITRSASRGQRLLRHLLGRRRSDFVHIPNKRIGLFAYLKDMLQL